ncbi:RNA polymerase sigma factor [Alicycliphilus denitrificans]|uniref:RNA polymerase sigma factor n=1 Tax=Alicycliphilus denitrificans TaxID=179636 RepID=UPI00384B1032
MNRAQIVDQLPGLRRYARALTGDPWAADDLVQDTLERACRKWLLWRSGSDLRAWLFTLMHNLYLNQRRGLIALQTLDSEMLATLAGTDGVACDTAIDLDRCLQRLPAEQRAVLLLVTLEDMAYADVARILGIPVGTVMSRLSRARGRMRELMELAPAHAPHANTARPTPLKRMK